VEKFPRVVLEAPEVGNAFEQALMFNHDASPPFSEDLHLFFQGPNSSNVV
jgi:hypothetical protein